MVIFILLIRKPRLRELLAQVSPASKEQPASLLSLKLCCLKGGRERGKEGGGECGMVGGGRSRGASPGTVPGPELALF